MKTPSKPPLPSALHRHIGPCPPGAWSVPRRSTCSKRTLHVHVAQAGGIWRDVFPPGWRKNGRPDMALNYICIICHVLKTLKDVKSYCNWRICPIFTQKTSKNSNNMLLYGSERCVIFSVFCNYPPKLCQSTIWQTRPKATAAGYISNTLCCL